MKKNEATCDCNIIHTSEVDKVKQNMLCDEVLMETADFYRTLGDYTRIKIISALTVGELCVCDISSVLNMTKSAVSHQLRALREMNLIKSEKRGKEVWYSLADKHVEEVFAVSLEHVLEEHADKFNENCNCGKKGACTCKEN